MDEEYIYCVECDECYEEENNFDQINVKTHQIFDRNKEDIKYLNPLPGGCYRCGLQNICKKCYNLGLPYFCSLRCVSPKIYEEKTSLKKKLKKSLNELINLKNTFSEDWYNHVHFIIETKKKINKINKDLKIMKPEPLMIYVDYDKTEYLEF